MKNKLLLLFTTIFIFASCTTNEERAEKLISNCIKDFLTYPESYEVVSTRIDSTNINIVSLEEILEITKEVRSLNDKVKLFERRMKYSSEKDEKNEYNSHIKRLKQSLSDKISTLRVATENLYIEENSWIVTHRFRCKNGNGVQFSPQEMIFFCDLNFEYCQWYEAKTIEIIFKFVEYINISETDNIFLEYLNDNLYLFNFL